MRIPPDLLAYGLSWYRIPTSWIFVPICMIGAAGTLGYWTGFFGGLVGLGLGFVLGVLLVVVFHTMILPHSREEEFKERVLGEIRAGRMGRRPVPNVAPIPVDGSAPRTAAASTVGFDRNAPYPAQCDAIEAMF
ncbi:MAG: hypothetical protein AAGF12_35315, partial [Myxococcota bacterium]